MTRMFAALVLLAALVLPVHAEDPELAGKWIGAIDTPSRGQMEFGLELRVEKGKLVGAVKTGHGDWEVTSVTEKAGVWTVAFKGEPNEGTMTGRIKDGKFTGEWKSKLADGTFELVRPKTAR